MIKVCTDVDKVVINKRFAKLKKNGVLQIKEYFRIFESL